MTITPYKWYDYLPHDSRRAYYRKYNPKKYWELLYLRNQKNNSLYSLAGFEQKKCIFVHIPKCAGISVSKSLFNNLGGGHLSIMDYQLIYGQSKFKDFFTFTFVRNPWDRVFSAYNFLNKGGFDKADKLWAEENLSCFNSFNQFVCTWVTEKNIYSWNHFIPQYRFVCDPYGNIKVNFIGRFESIENDFKYISQKINCNDYLEHTNKSNNSMAYKEFYTKKSIEIIRNIYTKDIELFGYNF